MLGFILAQKSRPFDAARTVDGQSAAINEFILQFLGCPIKEICDLESTQYFTASDREEIIQPFLPYKYTIGCFCVGLGTISLTTTREANFDLFFLLKIARNLQQQQKQWNIFMYFWVYNILDLLFTDRSFYCYVPYPNLCIKTKQKFARAK